MWVYIIMVYILVKNKEAFDRLRVTAITRVHKFGYQGVEIRFTAANTRFYDITNPEHNDDIVRTTTNQPSDVGYIYDPVGIFPLDDGSIIKNIHDYIDDPVAIRKFIRQVPHYQHLLEQCRVRTTPQVVACAEPDCYMYENRVMFRHDNAWYCRFHCASQYRDMLYPIGSITDKTAIQHEIIRQMTTFFRVIILVYGDMCQYVCLLGNDYYISTFPIPNRFLDKEITTVATPARKLCRPSSAKETALLPLQSTYRLGARRRIRIDKDMIKGLDCENDVLFQRMFGHLPVPDADGVIKRKFMPADDSHAAVADGDSKK